jgi:hypothetical protein
MASRHGSAEAAAAEYGLGRACWNITSTVDGPYIPKHNYRLLKEDPECAANWSTVMTFGLLKRQFFPKTDFNRARKHSLSSQAYVINSTLGSSLPSGASTYLSAYFHVSNQQQLVLPNSTYLIGYIFGPPLFSPLSETYGRKIVMLCTFAGFTIFTMACALVRIGRYC